MFGDIKTNLCLISDRIGIQSQCGSLYSKVHYTRKDEREKGSEVGREGGMVGGNRE